MNKVYFIREKWHLSFAGMHDIEIHDEKTNPRSNIVKSMAQVRKYIREWLENWDFNANDSRHRFIEGETDFKTYARCKIRNESGGLDKFELVVVNNEIGETRIYKFLQGKFKKTNVVKIPNAD